MQTTSTLEQAMMTKMATGQLLEKPEEMTKEYTTPRICDKVGLTLPAWQPGLAA
jgi:hypothetical protein